MVRDWKLSSGYTVGFTPKEKGFRLIFFKDHVKFTAYINNKYPEYLKGTEEELILELCKAYNKTPEEVRKFKMSFICIHQLINEKQSFLNWYSFNKDKK